jgi:4-amino-4-deoxy-L-arabinose transferase-like glycosyltransferase
MAPSHYAAEDAAISLTTPAAPPVAVTPSGGNRTPRLVLAGILAAYLALATGYSLAVRLNFAPDEPWHFRYVESLAQGHFPSPAYTDAAQHPPLYYLLATPVWALASRVLPPDPAERVLRLFSALLGVGSVLVAYRLGKIMFAAERWALFAAAFVAFTPLFGVMSGVVNNDSLTVLLSSLVMLQLITLPSPPTTRRLLALGGSLGLCLLTKQSTLALLPLVLPALWWATPTQHRLTTILRSLPPLCLPPALLYGGWLLRNQVAFGSQFIYTTIPAGQSQGQALLLAEPAFMLGAIARRSMGSIFFPEWVVRYWLGWAHWFTTLSALGLLLAVVGLAVAVRRGLMPPRLQQFCSLCLGLVLLLAAGLLAYIYLVDFRAMVGGRYFLPALPSLAVLVTGGVRGFVGGGRRRELAAVTLLVCLALLFALGFLVAVGWHYQHLPQ